MRNKITAVCLLALMYTKAATAQNKPVANPVLTADSLSTGKFKDVLNSFFQLSFDKLTGPDKELKFTSSPFAVMARMDTTLLVDTSYLKYKGLRKLNFTFGLKLDSSYKFNGFSSGIKYALINQRDETVSKAFVSQVINNAAVKQVFTLNSLMASYLSTLGAKMAIGQSRIQDFNDFISNQKNFDEIDNVLRDSIVTIAGKNKASEKLAKALVETRKYMISPDDTTTLKKALAKYLVALADNTTKAINASTAYDDFITGKKNFNDLDKEMRDKMISIAEANNTTSKIADTLRKNPKFNINKTAQDIYQKMKEDFNKNLLWTIGLNDTTYKDQFFFSNIVISSELLKGMKKYATGARSDVELNIKTALQFTDDTTAKGRDLKRSVFSIDPGFNLVLKGKTTGKSYLEFNLGGGYMHVFNGLYKDEEANKVTLNGTLRIRVFSDIWIPLEIKYDTKKGNLFGFLNVRANFKALGNAAKSLL